MAEKHDVGMLLLLLLLLFFCFSGKDFRKRPVLCAVLYPILTFATRSLLVRPSFAELKRWHEVLTDKKYSRYTVFMLTAEENKWNFIHIYVTVFFRTLVFFRTFDLPRSVIGKKFTIVPKYSLRRHRKWPFLSETRIKSVI